MTHYLGKGVTPASILRHAAHQAQVHCAPTDMRARFTAAADVVEHTGRMPDWALPAHLEKVEQLPVLREDESE